MKNETVSTSTRVLARSSRHRKELAIVAPVLTADELELLHAYRACDQAGKLEILTEARAIKSRQTAAALRQIVELVGQMSAPDFDFDVDWLELGDRLRALLGVERYAELTAKLWLIAGAPTADEMESAS